MRISGVSRKTATVCHHPVDYYAGSLYRLYFADRLRARLAGHPLNPNTSVTRGIPVGVGVIVISLFSLVSTSGGRTANSTVLIMKSCMRYKHHERVLTALAATLPFAANAADAISGVVERQPTNWQAIIMFLIFVVFTLGITYWASKRVRSRNDYYTAGGNITGFQNGLAIAGDYVRRLILGDLRAGVYLRL